MKHFFLLILTLCLLLSTLCGCGKTSSLIRYDISSSVSNLDPQFATDETDQMVIHNLFEGLLRQLPNGEIVNALAESYIISQNDTVYTFYLRQDARWRTEAPVTAADFVYAFRRIFNALSPSPYTQYYLSLKNAQSILNGDVPVEALGVRAIDDYTLEFQLSQPDSSFLESLCHSAAMPCNQEFFEGTRGKYGTTRNSVTSCGPFFLNLWDDEKLYLKKNTMYYDEYSVQTPGVYLYIGREKAAEDGEEAVSLYDLVLEGKSDSCPVTFEQAEAAKALGYSCQEHIGTVWGLVVNPKHPQLSNEQIRRSFFHSINREELDGYLTKNMVLTDRLIAPEISLFTESYVQSTSVKTNLYAPMEAQEERKNGLEELGSLTLDSMELLVPEGGNVPFLSGMLQQMWQRNLSAFVNIVALPQAELEKRVAEGNYDLAIVPFISSANTPYDILSRFASDSALNQWGYSSETYDELLRTASVSSEEAVSRSAYVQSEELLYSDCAVFPLFYEISYILFAPNVSGIEIYPYGGMVRFQNAVAIR